MYKLLFIVCFSIAYIWSLPLESFSDGDFAEYGKYFEGDMILNEEQLEAISSPIRNGIIATKYRWPNKTVPYQLSSNHTKNHQNYIELGLRTIEAVSCVKFVRRTNEANFVNMTGQNDGCYSEVGYQNEPQILNLANYDIGKGCFRLGSIMHEFLHALGFYHMQSTHDRDEYVTIHWENILKGTEENFEKLNNTIVSNYNTTYDYFSILHYSAYGFSTNGNATIVPKDESYLKIIGQRFGLSDKDIFKLNKMYECENDSSN